MSGWINVKDKLQEYNVDVLVYYTIERKDKTKMDMIEIGYLNSTTVGKDFKWTEWQDRECNALHPLFWHELPELPSINAGESK